MKRIIATFSYILNYGGMGNIVNPSGLELISATSKKKIMNFIKIVILLLLSHIQIFSQTWVDCNEMVITVDDFNSTLDFENQPDDCGCNFNGECTLVRIRLVETINGVETPVSTTGIGFQPPLAPDAEPNQIWKDYIDLFDPYFNCTEYQAAGGQNHNYLISPVFCRDEFHVLVCPGSEQALETADFLPPGEQPQTLQPPQMFKPQMVIHLLI
ncbi:MAG: hypothetical protein R2766_01095 [Saprospiraceae bacterium]